MTISPQDRAGISCLNHLLRKWVYQSVPTFSRAEVSVCAFTKGTCTCRFSNRLMHNYELRALIAAGKLSVLTYGHRARCFAGSSVPTQPKHSKDGEIFSSGQE